MLYTSMMLSVCILNQFQEWQSLPIEPHGALFPLDGESILARQFSNFLGEPLELPVVVAVFLVGRHQADAVLRRDVQRAEDYLQGALEIDDWLQAHKGFNLAVQQMVEQDDALLVGWRARLQLVVTRERDTYGNLVSPCHELSQIVAPHRVAGPRPPCSLGENLHGHLLFHALLHTPHRQRNLLPLHRVGREGEEEPRARFENLIPVLQQLPAKGQEGFFLVAPNRRLQYGLAHAEDVFPRPTTAIAILALVRASVVEIARPRSVFPCGSRRLIDTFVAHCLPIFRFSLPPI